MRRRVVIGAFAVIVVAGILGFALSGPKKGSIEWHKKQWRAAVYGGVMRNFIRGTWRGVTGHDFGPNPDMGEAIEHEQALLDLGYWEKRTFVVSSQPNGLGYELISQGWKIVPESDVFFVGVGTNSVWVLAMPRYLPQFEAALRKLDVP